MHPSILTKTFGTKGTEAGQENCSKTVTNVIVSDDVFIRYIYIYLVGFQFGTIVFGCRIKFDSKPRRWTAVRVMKLAVQSIYQMEKEKVTGRVL